MLNFPKNEYEIGYIGLIDVDSLSDIFVVSEATSANKCNECYFEPFPYNCCCHNIRCKAQERDDQTDVIFRQIII